LLVLVVLLTSLGSFSIGWIARGQSAAATSIQTAEIDLPDCTKSSSQASNESENVLVGSKNSDKFHYRWCSGADRINEDNLISFENKEAARSAGYSPAGNCPGLTTKE
jgi:hypothetical protein